VQIMAYELRMASLSQAPASADTAPLAHLDDIEFFYQKLEETLIRIQFLDPQHPKRLMPRIRRMFARTQLEKDEFNILMGILKQVNLFAKSKVD
jgi:tRNA/rRNA methyltransferase